LKVPQNEDEWMIIAEQFERMWQMPNCVGALDGKHIRITKPFHSGSDYFNYKGFFSIVLMALVDAQCNFIYVDVGAQGRISDGGVFSNCTLSKAMENGSLKFPPAKQLRLNSGIDVPYFTVADDAFPLKPFIMKPYSKRSLTHEEQIANYRISRARRTVENAFGVLANVFRLLHTPILLQPIKATTVIQAMCVLHNFLRQNSDNTGARNMEEVTSTDDLFELTPLRSNTHNYSQVAKEIRDELKVYFNTNGTVDWQERCAQNF
jgi:hypothetical protein